MSNKKIIQWHNQSLESLKNILTIPMKKQGKYIWSKLTKANGEFICFATSDDEAEYPNGGVHTDGFFYIRISSTGQPIMFSYTGTYNFKTEIDKKTGGMAWELKLLTSGVLIIDEVVTPYNDVFVVGGGGGGAGGSKGGAVGGGGGGYTLAKLNVKLQIKTACEVIVGAGGRAGRANTSMGYGKEGGDGGRSSIMGFSANGGKGSRGLDGGNGGSGGGAAGRSDYGGTELQYSGAPGTGQKTTTRAFGEPSGTLYAGGGGGGGDADEGADDHYNNLARGGDGGTDGSSGSSAYIVAHGSTSIYGAGGGGGGGIGGQDQSKDGQPGTANTGGGGGGGGGYAYIGSSSNGGSGSNGGAGGSGIIILRGRYS